MRKLTLLILVAAAACNSANNSTMNNKSDSSDTKTESKSTESEWVSLFDGATTKGWHTYGKSTIGKAWKAENGVLYLDSKAKKDWQTEEGGDIVTDEEFENYHLKLEWKIAPKGNSGIIFNIHEDSSKYEHPWHTGPEMQVLDNGTSTSPGHPDAKITSHRAGDLYDLIVSKEAVKPVGEWNEVEIISNKGQLQFRMNGQETLSTTMWDDNWRGLIAKSKFKSMEGFGTFKKGRIALQDHGDNVWFRNIRIRKL